MKHINITNADIVKNMNDEQKHNLANICIANGTEPEEVISLIKKMTNITINSAIDLCNNYFKTPTGKQYLEMRKKIDRLGEWLNDKWRTTRKVVKCIWQKIWKIIQKAKGDVRNENNNIWVIRIS